MRHLKWKCDLSLWFVFVTAIAIALWFMHECYVCGVLNTVLYSLHNCNRISFIKFRVEEIIWQNRMNFHTDSPLNVFFSNSFWFFTNSICLFKDWIPFGHIKTYSRFETWIDAMKNFIKIVIIWFQHRWNSNKLWILLHSYIHKEVSVITFINRIYNGIFNLIIAEYQFFIGINAIF